MPLLIFAANPINSRFESIFSHSWDPISTVLLTSADVDSVMGLLHLREFQPLHILSTVSVRRILTEENGLFRVLARSNPPVKWDAMPLDRLMPLVPPSAPGKKDGLFYKGRPSLGNSPDYVSDSLRGSLPPKKRSSAWF